MDIVEKYSGSILQFAGGAVIAFWHPSDANPSHAQLAFDASREVLAKLPALMASQKHISYKLRIALGTGDMAGDWFGPIKQFQVVGKAMTTADRLIRTPPILDSTVQMSQYTYNLICPHEGIKETGSIGRDNLEDLKVFTYAPENSPGQGTAKTPRSTFSSTLRGAAARFFKR